MWRACCLAGNGINRRQSHASLPCPAAFENDFGRFRYLTIPMAVYPVGVQRVTESDLPFLIASSPRRAVECHFTLGPPVNRFLNEPSLEITLEISESIP